MKVLLDTSVLVAALVEPHPEHERAFRWLRKAKSRSSPAVVSSHSIAELFGLLTAMPLSPRISPGLAWRLIHESVEPHVSFVSLTPSEYLATVRQMSELGISGGAVYDALIVKAAQKSKIEAIVTLNPSDFRRIWPEGANRILAP